jgi:hypothetical protein
VERICVPTQPEMVLEYDAQNQREFELCPDYGQGTKHVIASGPKAARMISSGTLQYQREVLASQFAAAAD